jgi:hypothetical protein
MCVVGSPESSDGIFDGSRNPLKGADIETIEPFLKAVGHRVPPPRAS